MLLDLGACPQELRFAMSDTRHCDSACVSVTSFHATVPVIRSRVFGHKTVVCLHALQKHFGNTKHGDNIH